MISVYRCEKCNKEVELIVTNVTKDDKKECSCGEGSLKRIEIPQTSPFIKRIFRFSRAIV